MALKKNPPVEETQDSESMQKAKELFKKEPKRRKKENKVLTTFSIEPSFKAELEDMFADMGLGWAAGIRFALREFIKKYSE
ncbi:MAG: hypothetical protein WC224_03225 [Sphaerochaetaceae bacterium]